MSLDETNNPIAKNAPKAELDPSSHGVDTEKGDVIQPPTTHASLANLGIEQELEKTIGPLGIVSVGYNICNSWVGLAATLTVSLESGGSVSIVYGILVVLFALGCSAASMAELSSVYPTAGGPYHWASILAPKKYHRVISYACAAFNIYGWLSICVGVTVQIGTFVNGMRVFYNPSLDLPVWHDFLYYQATNIVILLYNIFVLRKTQWIHSVGAVFSLAAFIAVFVTSLSRAESYSSSSFVWTYYPDHDWTWDSRGLVFLTGMANPNFMYAGIDGAIHLAEECTDATKTVPRALFSSIVIGFVTAFPFAVAMLYCLTDIDKVMEDLTGVPIYEIWYQATRSREAATVFVTCLLTVALFALNACQEVASRLTWAFARDNALVGSKLFGHIDKRLQVPVWALAGNALVIFIIGCIQLGSSTAFEAFVGSGMLLQQCGFAIPVALLLWHKRSEQVLAKDRSVRLGPFGWLANIVTVLFAILVTVMYCFPVRLPVTGGNMNYTAAVVGVMAIFAVANWFIHANRIAGLTLAQALRRHGIPCTVFERDDSPEVRHQGWGVSIHSTLTTWEAHVLPEIYDRVCEAQVNPAVGRDEVRGVPWINGATGKVEQSVPKSKRLRLRRDGIRRALMEGLDIKWGKRLVDIEKLEAGIRARFTDGTTTVGNILVGADGSMSMVRQFLAPTNHKLHRLPINALGCAVMMSEEQVEYFKDHVDPLYFMGTHPETDTFVFWSLLDTPTAPGRPYRAQVYFSWMESDADEGLFNQPLLEVFKQKGRPFFPRMRDMVDSLPDDTVVTSVNLVDWPSVEWDNWNGTATLIGDAAHCMVICKSTYPWGSQFQLTWEDRGEGVNHAIVDACQLADTIKSAADGHMSMNDAVREYEKQMRPRAREAVQTSRQAGHDGHCYSKVDKEGSFALLGEKPV